jgi:hypothetical protein
MELLLNLLWLLLAMPAFWLWRYSRIAPKRRKFDALQSLLALGCLLVILFPVISASDDLRAMRAEMEESHSKKSIAQSGGIKANSLKWQAQPALPAASASGGGVREFAHYWCPAAASSPSSIHVIARSGRAPPSSLIA